MGNRGNFLEYAASKCGVDVGFGKLIVVYPKKTTVALADLTAAAINRAVEAGEIIGVIRGWHTIAGASVAEINVERPGTAEMKLIREEIAADTLTFESSIANNEVIGDLVKAGSLNCILFDDSGHVFGDYSQTAGSISTMLLNFSGKTTSSLQKDNATEKTVAVTVRYLVTNLNILEAGVETELVAGKTLLVGQLKSIDTMTATSYVFDLILKSKTIGSVVDTVLTVANVRIKGTNANLISAVYVAGTGVMTLTMVGTSLPVDVAPLLIAISGEDVYMKETRIILGE